MKIQTKELLLFLFLLQLNDDNNQVQAFNENYYETSTFPVMDSSGKVSTPQALHFHTKYNQRGTALMHSGNTPMFPSVFGKRLEGFPTHIHPNLNAFVADSNQNTPAAKRAQRAYGMFPESSPLNWRATVLGSSIVPTKESDQGPLDPAPKSLMERAGWWEYLALLFGDSGDSTALRLILHRLTQLAQLQLGQVEAGRVQAATAFLSQHFKPLLASTFQDFVYDPDYSRRTTAWSNDPVFGGIIRKLVDQMDFFGAKTDLEHYFGTNSSVVLSYGMRQPEWLRLKLIIEQIAWDLKHPDDLISLWSPAWNLTVPQKLSILAYASDPKLNAPLDFNLPSRDLVMARVNLITNGQSPKDMKMIERRESPLDLAHYHFAIQQASGELCKKDGSNAKSSQENLTSKIPTTNEASGLKRRVDDYCELTNLTPNFVQFCQTGPYDSTPIASILSAAKPLFKTKVVAYINHLERLFWALMWSGSCQDSREALATLTNQVKLLGPRETLARQGKRVPSDIADAVKVRLDYMQAVQQTCQGNIQISMSADVAHIFSLLNYQHIEEALYEWERRFSSVAARLQGYPGGSVTVSGDAQLLYHQARDVRIALLIYKYPRVVYMPCMGRGLLTRDPSTDLMLLNLAHSIDTRFLGSNPDPMIPEMSTRSLYMRALYLAGRYVDAARVAREIAAVSNNDDSVQEFLACTQLCGSATRNPCEAQKSFTSLLLKVHSDSNAANTNTQVPADPKKTARMAFLVGKELSSRLCRLSRNTAADALSLRYGKVLTTQATFTALKRVVGIKEHEHAYSKLLPGSVESTLPWFGTLPPAPVDEIVSFVPNTKLNFKYQVGIHGLPEIKSEPTSGPEGDEGSSDNKSKSGKIFVLGKQYEGDFLGHPKTKIENGYFQLVTDLNTTKKIAKEENFENDKETKDSESSGTQGQQVEGQPEESGQQSQPEQDKQAQLEQQNQEQIATSSNPEEQEQKQQSDPDQQQLSQLSDQQPLPQENLEQPADQTAE